MATVRRVVRVTNGRKRRRAVGSKRRKKNGSKSPAIRRYTVKALKKELTRRGAKPKTARRKRGTRRSALRKRNPVLIELGSVLNPRKRRKNVATKKKNSRRRRRSVARRNPRRVRRVRATVTRRRRTVRRRRNPVVVVAPRRRNRRRRTVNSRRHRRHHARRRRNPALFGHSGGKNLVMMVGGGLVGVAAAKFIPTIIPSSITSMAGSGSIMTIAISGASAFAASWLARKVSPQFGDAVLMGGLMQTGSVALTALAPPALAARLALSGLGDIVPANFVVPQNPIRAGQVVMLPPANNGGMGALRRAGNFR